MGNYYIDFLALLISDIYMNSETDQREEFLRAEASIGITRKNYQQKFIYQPHQNSENYLLDRCTATPSQLQGFSIEHQKCIGYLMSEMLFRAAESLRLPVSTAVVAASISHFFFSRLGYLDYDFRDVAMGAMFLACKSEETLRRSFQVSSVFDHIFKIFQGQKAPIKIQVLQSLQYEYMRNKVLELQKQILFQEGFEIYRLFDIPHRYIGGLFKSFERHPQGKKICQQAWVYLNDFYRTNVCLYYPGQIIAAASVYASLLKLKIKMPTVPWWVLMEANIQSIEELVGELQYFYQQSKGEKYTLDLVAGYISAVGERHELINVFPVNYYRKIIFDTNHQFKIKKKPAPEKEAHSLQAEIKEQNEDDNDKDGSSESSSRKRRKRKDKKQKRDKKDKKRKREKEKEKYRKYDEEEQAKPFRSRSREQRKSSISQSQRPSSEIAELASPKEAKGENPQSALIQIDPTKPQNTEDIKDPVRNLQIQNKNDLLSKINIQLSKFKKHEKKEQEREQSDEDEDELMAELIKIKKNNAQKKA